MLITEYHWVFVSLTGGCTASSASILVKTPHYLKFHVAADMFRCAWHVLLYMTFLCSNMPDTFSLNIGTIHPTIYQTLNAFIMITHCSKYRKEACQLS